MTTITLPRAVVEQALEALEWISDCYVGDDDDAGECASCHQRSYKPHAPDCKKNNAITALRAALAQQAEQQPMHPELRKMWEDHFDKCFRAIPVPEQAEPVEPVDVGLLEYRGNSVAFIHQKMTAYRTGIDVAWDAFRAKGLHPDGKTSLADMIAKYTAPPQRKPLTEEVAALIAQRDALLEALKLARPYINPNTPYGYYAEVKADAAIKAVEEGK